PKDGSSGQEFEDAFYPLIGPDGLELETSSFRIAVADGATEAAFSALWAKMIVRKYCSSAAPGSALASFLPTLQRRWFTHVTRRPIAWYLEEKVREGAAAALLGLSLRAPEPLEPDHRWEATSVGDCIMVQIRADDIVSVFPNMHAADFSQTPFLLSTSPAGSSQLGIHMKTQEGLLQDDDLLFLMTDALGAWFLRSVESGGAPWTMLRELGRRDQDRFAAWIRDLRATKQMRNDDVTLIRIDVWLGPLHRTTSLPSRIRTRPSATIS
ncbi:MAG: protein phosphatase 2C domain-containing protein, partial [Thermoanaerobaculia bacterium]|nr:protein phosphatase 2C domain-containing protein [Thermoanaerobaculia bacterium]